ncbi:Nuclear pore complex FG-nucleoporin component [Komagataella phaffii CBS 7435]|uniref:Nucleoporin, essential subunit of the nuclear pore complex (NPC) n=2 Tax=Komagataella phaffii TaxID=460519 RepID=C4R7M3_KOMPG|nr:Nucleoporin, essential subunit of the nuclear pore complex (NPC) [Komagataella phaffii GS115]AOA65005.1 GQ67_04695T0 [Komagataella phaffii]CAH2451024.1 Nuclear pore complex FG-nucleoporin component [Komagataella phaffii CBS 7435]AOA70210.1 GQ68_04667T0 [Komagataella phaffii GS115]CAY71598.1 Nucleoporin, essential subunit of the nuclear pore complex (NPC) [Komagataella phaffii GS115]CCA40797.1 Nuclear pore complex FG-nucleoporin component [Komagataella phaffii CBS 7435]
MSFNFGAKTNAAPGNTSTGGFSFGSNTSNNAAPAAGSSSFSFGAKPTSGGLNLNTNPSSSNSGGLFGAKPAGTTGASTGLFGANTGANTGNTSNTTSGGLFGNNNNTNVNNTASGGLFGNNASNANNTTSGGLFGNANANPNNGNTNNAGSGGLFGGNNNTASGGLFGNKGTSTNSGGLFGTSNTGNTTNTGAPSGGLFGSTNNTGTSSGLFGGNTSTNTSNTAGGLFGNNANTNANNQVNNNVPTSAQPSFAWSQQQKSQPSNALQQMQSNQAVATFNNNSNNYTPTITDQIIKVKNSWDPSSPNCMLKTHFYNKLPSNESLANVQRPQDELPEEWEKAMSNRPTKYNSIPVKAKGFDDLLTRANTQTEHVRQSRIILNTINDNLTDLGEKHDLNTSARLTECKVKYKNLSKKLLRLAIILSVLKSRGYPLSTDEEHLKLEFEKLFNTLNDPAGLGRTNELWGRLSNLRERAKNLSQQQQKESGLLITQEQVQERDLSTTSKVTDVLGKQQQGIQYLYELIQTDKEKLDKLLEKVN